MRRDTGYGGASGRGRLGPALLAALAAAAFAALTAGPATALTGRGHEPAFSFGGDVPARGGLANGGLSDPQGVAVDEAAGLIQHVYVVDSSDNRLSVYEQNGRFIEDWGWG